MARPAGRYGHGGISRWRVAAGQQRHGQQRICGHGRRGRCGGGRGPDDEIANSIAVANGTPACVGAPADGGHNISLADATCPGASADPLLGPLADNGGPTPLTRKPGPGSAALDLVPLAGAGCVATDERLVPRPQGGGCEAGAYELAPPGVTLGDPSAITETSVVLGGVINPNAQASSVHFEFGTTTAYGFATAGAEPARESERRGGERRDLGLAPGTTSHLRLVATNADGASATSDRTFTTAKPGGVGPGVGPGGGPGGGGADKDAPVFLSASVKPSVFAVDRKGAAQPPVAARVAHGTRFRYRLSEAARVVFTIQRRRGKRFRSVPGASRRGRGPVRTPSASRAGSASARSDPGRYRAVPAWPPTLQATTRRPGGWRSESSAGRPDTPGTSRGGSSTPAAWARTCGRSARRPAWRPSRR